MKNIIYVVVLQTLPGCTVIRSGSSGEKLTCEQHESVAVILNEWAINNFNEAYEKTGDANGAAVQLFLIEHKSPSPYAAAFNRYQEKAAENIKLANKKSCEISGYPAPPVDEFKRRLEILNRSTGEKR